MIRPREVMYSIVDFRVWVSRSLSAELENRPIVAMLVIKEFDKLICWIPICFLGPG